MRRPDIVTDEQGRRRFHGAFTGGFSAGYYNTCGSEVSEHPIMDGFIIFIPSFLFLYRRALLPHHLSHQGLIEQPS